MGECRGGGGPWTREALENKNVGLGSIFLQFTLLYVVFIWVNILYRLLPQVEEVDIISDLHLFRDDRKNCSLLFA
jgi:hypothetical protein